MYADLAFELQHIEPYEDSIATINQLKSTGYKVVLCSNTAKPYCEKVSSLLPPCDAYSWSYETGVNKPNPRIYQHFIDLLNCKPEEILFIGDTQLADVEGPLAIGMHARLIDRKNGQVLSEIIL
jgi:HAD superfamily hydrolase (TIGR01549 family)